MSIVMGRVKLTHMVEGAVRVVVSLPRTGSKGVKRFRPDESLHVRVPLGGRMVWVDANTGEELAVSDLERSARRARSNLLMRACSTTWDWFGTLTLDREKLPEGLSRRDVGAVDWVYEWFHKLRARYPEMMYILVPECHKNGAYHFHVLLAGVPSALMAPAMKGATHIHHAGNPVFHFLPFQHGVGFTSMTAVRSSLRVARYMVKYLTKSMGSASVVGLGRRRFTCSHNVPKCADTVIDDVFVDVSGMHVVGEGFGVWVSWSHVDDPFVRGLLGRASLIDVPAVAVSSA
jgi:hypothetical protein